MRIVAGHLLAAFVIVTALAAVQGGPPMRTIDKGTQSGIDVARTVVARTPQEWTAIWRAHAGDKPAPSVDFTKEMIVGVFLGSRPTAGHSVEIVGTRDAPIDTLIVEYREGSPPRDMMTAQVITTPYHLVALAARQPSVRFEKLESEK